MKYPMSRINKLSDKFYAARGRFYAAKGKMTIAFISGDQAAYDAAYAESEIAKNRVWRLDAVLAELCPNDV